MAKLFHFDPEVTSCSVGGVEFVRGEDGSFVVEEAAVAHLLDHGFRTSLDAAKAAAVPAVADVQKVIVDLQTQLEHVTQEAAQAEAARGAAVAEAEQLRAKVAELEEQVEALTRPGKRRG